MISLLHKKPLNNVLINREIPSYVISQIGQLSSKLIGRQKGEKKASQKCKIKKKLWVLYKKLGE